jgi:hypothetical protein
MSSTAPSKPPAVAAVGRSVLVPPPPPGAPASTPAVAPSGPSTASLVSQLQSELNHIIAKATVDAPHLCGKLTAVNGLVSEVVSRWRRSTALALSNIKSYEDLISQKSIETESLTQQLREKVARPSLSCVLAGFTHTARALAGPGTC